jgi:hypothetical protein
MNWSNERARRCKPEVWEAEDRFESGLYNGLHLDVQVNDDFETPAQARLRLSTRTFANFAP